MGRKVRTKVIAGYSRYQLNEGVSQFWLKFFIRTRTGKMKKSNKDGQLWLGRHEAGFSCWRGCWWWGEVK